MIDPFTLTYTPVPPSPPDDAMLEELTAYTSAYIDEFHRIAYEGFPVQFDRAETSFKNFTSPNRVEYETTFYFFPATEDVGTPPKDELINGVSAIFNGEPAEAYIEFLDSMSDTNVFKDSTGVQFDLSADLPEAPAGPGGTQPAGDDRGQGGDTGTNGAGDIPATAVPPMPTYDAPTRSANSSGGGGGMLAAASAGAFVLVVAGYVMYRRSTEEIEPAGKFIDPDGHMTITGDTYVGGQSMEDSTYAGTHSAEEGEAAQSQGLTSYRSETPEWKEYHAGEEAMMTESEWEEYQETLDKNRTASPFEAIPEEREAEEEADTKLPYGDDDDSFPERVVQQISALDDVTL